MKSFLVIGCLLLLTDVIRAEKINLVEILQEHITPCAEEHNISPTELSKFEEIDLEGDDKTKFGCLKACVMKHMNILEDGEVKADKFQEMAEKVFADDADKVAKEMETLTTCAAEVKDKTDECEFAYEFSRCMMIKANE